MEITILDYSNNIWTIEVDDSVFGSTVTCELELTDNDEVNEIYTFELRGFYYADVTEAAPYNEVEVNSTIDPAKVLLWILKKIKEAICPECL